MAPGIFQTGNPEIILQIIANQIPHPTTIKSTTYHNCAYGKYISIKPPLTKDYPIVLYIEKSKPQEAFLSIANPDHHQTHIPLADPQLIQKINEFLHQHLNEPHPKTLPRTHQARQPPRKRQKTPP